MTSSTSAGTTLAVTAAVPLALNAAGYAGLTFTTIAGVESISAFGATSAVNSFQPLNGPQEKHKGPVNNGSLQVPMAIDNADAGQTIMRTLGEPANNAQGSFLVTFPNGDRRYFRGRVFGAPETVGSATNVLMMTPTVEINTDVVRVNAAAVAVPSVPSEPTLTGFYLNGSTNTKLLAALQGVKAGTRRGRFGSIGDSTDVGQGTGTNTDAYGLTNARPNRIAAVLAGLLSAAGIRALDNGLVGDNGMTVANNFVLPVYDPRIMVQSPFWTLDGGATFAGGNYLVSHSGLFKFDLPNVDTFEVVAYRSANATLNFAIDGAAPSSGPSAISLDAAGGFTRTTIKASAVGYHQLQMADIVDTNPQAVAVQSVIGYNSTQPAIDFLVHSALGATSADQTASSSGVEGQNWSALEALDFAAFDFVRIRLGYNDMAQGVAAAEYGLNIARAIAKVKASGGDALVIFQPPAGGIYNANAADFNASAKAAAASAGVAFFSEWEYYGQVFTPAIQARMFDGGAHNRAEFAAEIAGLEFQAIKAMAPAAFA